MLVWTCDEEKEESRYKEGAEPAGGWREAQKKAEEALQKLPQCRHEG